MARVTIKDVARQAAVSPATVSFVMNSKHKIHRVNKSTCLRVRDIAATMGYVANAAAKSLVTNRTGSIGLLLSGETTDGWCNLHYTSCLSGVESACRDMGYGLSVNLYDMQSVDRFVFPDGVVQKRVDGLLLIGAVTKSVSEKFHDYGIPIVCIGDKPEVEDIAPVFSADVTGGYIKIVRYLSGIGHKHIMIWGSDRLYSLLSNKGVLEKAKSEFSNINIETPQLVGRFDDYRDAELIVGWYCGLAKSEKPTAIVVNDQIAALLPKKLRQAGLDCPKDLSIICSSDSRFCELAEPSITSLRWDSVALSRDAAVLLINHLEKGTELRPDSGKSDYPCELVMRDSCAEVKG